ncbi:MAG: Holliday junction resolvase RuvX [Eubacterium sp.]|nr:Holliday junction resolvase RuvX [Eubacterium sp.]
MGRILGLDYGARTVGVAVSDGLGLTAQGIEIIRREQETKLRKTLARIEELCRQYNVEKIVLGLPLHLNGDAGIRAEKSAGFKEKLEKRTGLEVILCDERLTTVMAYETMDTLGIRDRASRKKLVDEIAAVFILQDYLNQEYDKKKREEQNV